MKGIAKSPALSRSRSDRQHVWLSILLIITCVCLITTILIISFFVYREIERKAEKSVGDKGSHAEFKSESAARATVDFTELTLTPFTSTETPPRSTAWIIEKSLSPRKAPERHDERKLMKLNAGILLPKSTSPIGSSSGSEKFVSSTTKKDSEWGDLLFPDEFYKLGKGVENNTEEVPVAERTSTSTFKTSTISTTAESMYSTNFNTSFESEADSDVTAKDESEIITLKPTYSFAKKPYKHMYRKGDPSYGKRDWRTTPIESPFSHKSLDIPPAKTNESRFEKYVALGETIGYTITSTKEPQVYYEPTKGTPVTRDSYILESKPTKIEAKTYFVRSEDPTKTIIKYIEKDPPPPIKVCETIKCKLSASKMIALMDHSLDPCEDFYSYACRGMEINRMRNPQYEYVIIEKLEDIKPIDENAVKFERFLRSCERFNSTQGLVFLKDLVREIFYVAEGADKRDSLTQIITKIILIDRAKSMFGLMPIFDLTMEADSDGLFIPTLTVPSVDDEVIDGDCARNLSNVEAAENKIQEIVKRYEVCVKDAPNRSNLFDALRGLSGDLPVPGDADDISKILKLVPASINKRNWNEHTLNMSDKPVYMTMKNLHEKYPEINWAILLYTAFKGKDVSKVRIMFKDRLEKLFEFYQKASLKDLNIILRMMFIYNFYTEYFIEFDTLRVKEFCHRKAQYLMEDLVSKLLVSKTSPKDLDLLAETAKYIFNDLRAQLKLSIGNTTWLNDLQKNTILTKLDKLQINAGVNNSWFNDDLLKYRNGKLSITDNFVENIITVKRNKRRLIYDKVNNNPANKWIYKYNSLSTTPWVISEANQIVLPPGLLTKLAYKKRRTPQLYEIYAQLGFQIASSIAKFFEPNQLQRLIYRIEENEVYKNYLHIRLGDPQIAKSINKYNIAATKEDLALSKSSRFVDDLAVRLSLDAYKKAAPPKDLQLLWLNYTIPQLFYLALAQDFCKPEDRMIDLALSLYEDSVLPNYFRVNSLLMNSLGFSDAYHCPLGSAMNPPLKADAFPYITYTEIDYL